MIILNNSHYESCTLRLYLAIYLFIYLKSQINLMTNYLKQTNSIIVRNGC